MPSNPAAKPKKEDHNVRVSSYYVAIARRLAAEQDKPFAEILGNAVEIGLQSLSESATKMNIFQRTSSKAEVIRAIDAIPLERLEEAIEALLKIAELD